MHCFIAVNAVAIIRVQVPVRRRQGLTAETATDGVPAASAVKLGSGMLGRPAT
jgi:hypothetical protein